MVKAYIGLGSNVGDGKRTLQDAWQTLGKYEGIECLQLSSPYQSAPVDMESHNWFTNAVGVLTTTLEPLDVLKILLGVEAEFGRRRPENVSGYQDRSLDLDLLYFGDIVMASEKLTLPHPQITERLFVLKPLTELNQNFYDHARGLRAIEMVDQLQMKFTSKERELQEITRSSWVD